MSCWAFPDALSAFAEQKTCTLSRNQKQGARGGAQGRAVGGSVRGAQSEGLTGRVGSSGLLALCSTLSHPLRCSLLVEPRRGAVSLGAVSSPLPAGGQGPQVCNSSPKGPASSG